MISDLTFFNVLPNTKRHLKKRSSRAGTIIKKKSSNELVAVHAIRSDTLVEKFVCRLEFFLCVDNHAVSMVATTIYRIVLSRVNIVTISFIQFQDNLK